MKELSMKCLHDVSQVAKVVVVVAIPMCILLFHVWNQFKITQLGYDIAAVTHEHRGLLEEHKKLSIEAAVQGRTERMTALAREQFGLEQLRPEQVVTIRLEVDEYESDLGGREHALLDL